MSLADTVVSSEATRQADVAAAMAAYTGNTLAIAVRSAERRHRARIFEATHAANGVTAVGELNEMVGIYQPFESITATDATPFTLTGGRYIVKATATWGGGSVTLQDSTGNTFAAFTSNGSAIVNLRYGSFLLSIVTATAVSVTINRGGYTDGVASI